MHDFAPFPAAFGGVLIGVSASFLLLTHGRIAGISGIYGGALRRAAPERAGLLAFIAGLVIAGLVVRLAGPAAFESAPATPVVALVAGLFVGVGTQLGRGCTSGHGVCGLSRLSVRSLVATGTFMLTGVVTVFVVRHILPGGR